jgi:hypothetical protein
VASRRSASANTSVALRLERDDQYSTHSVGAHPSLTADRSDMSDLKKCRERFLKHNIDVRRCRGCIHFIRVGIRSQ